MSKNNIKRFGYCLVAIINLLILVGMFSCWTGFFVGMQLLSIKYCNIPLNIIVSSVIWLIFVIYTYKWIHEIINRVEEGYIRGKNEKNSKSYL